LICAKAKPVKVFNILGQEIKGLVNEQQPEGYYTMNGMEGTKKISGWQMVYIFAELRYQILINHSLRREK